MPSTHRLARQGSAVVLASFLAVSSSRAATKKPSVREIARRLRERPAVFQEEVRRRLAEGREARRQGGRLGRNPTYRPQWAQGISPRFHADGLATIEPRPLNPLLDPLGLFEDEAGEEPPIGALPRLFLADFDGDGDLDAFVGDKYGYVRYLRNDAEPGGEPVYVELTGAASPTGSLDLSFDDADMDLTPFGPSAPTLVDIDGDQDLDLFVGQGYYTGPGTGGRVLFFENVGGTLTRNDADNPFDGLVFGAGLATPTFVDVDGDDDFDAFVGTFYKPGAPLGGEVYFVRNEGDKNNPVMVDQTDVAGVDPFAGEVFPLFTAPYFADVDGDDDLDAFIGNFYLTRFFRNDTVLPGPPAFVEQTGYDNPLAGSFGFAPGPVLADVDGDGDLDAFVGVGYGKDYYIGFLQYFENTGTKNDSAFLSRGDRLELVDVDGDGDLDALVGNYGYSFREMAGEPGPPGVRGKAGAPGEGFEVWYFRNQGTTEAPVWKLQSGMANPFFTFNSGYGYGYYSYSFPSLAPTVGHLDGDAFLDAFVGTPYGYLEFLEDDGSGQLDPAATHPLESFDFGYGSSPDPHFTDINGDGELDLVVGYEPYNEGTGYYDSKVAFFINPTGPDGLDGPPDIVLDFTDTDLDRPAPTLVDVDGDGDLDLLVGGYYFEYNPDGPSAFFPTTLFVENTGTKTAPAFSVASAVPVEALIELPSSPAMGDVNGDGARDLFLGNLTGVEMFLTAVPEIRVTKAVTGGDLKPDGTVEYTITMINVGTGTQPDDPAGPELTDTLPPELTLLSASVVSGPGSVSVDLGANSLRYDGAIDPGESVSILVTAHIAPITLNLTILNQATVFVDANSDGTNDTPVPSDDPTTIELNDPTAFVVGAPLLEVPTLSQWGAALFAGLLSLLGLFGLRRLD